MRGPTDRPDPTERGLRRLAALGYEFASSTAARCQLVDYTILDGAVRAGRLVIDEETIRFADRELWAGYAAALEADPQETVDAHLVVARDAFATRRYAAACGHLKVALRFQPRTLSRSWSRPVLLLDLARAQSRAGMVADAWRTCQEAAALGLADHDPLLVADAAVVVRGSWIHLGLADEQYALCRQALQILPAEEVTRAARLHAQLAVTRHPWHQRSRPAGPARAPSPPDDPETRFLQLQAEHERRRGVTGVEQRLNLSDHAITLGEATGIDEYIAWGLLWRLDASYTLERRMDLDNDMLAFQGVVARLREPVWTWRLRCARVSLRVLEGDYDTALADAAAAREIGRTAGTPEADFLHLIVRSRIAEMTGVGVEDVEPAVRELTRRLPLAAREWHAHLLLRLGHRDEATAIWQALAHHVDDLSISTREWLLSTAGLADLCVEVGDRGRARHLYQRLLPYAHLHVIGNVLGPPHGPTSLPLGRLARLLGNLADARRHLDDAVRQAETMNSRPYADQARAELDVVTRAKGALSPREREIAELVAEGLSNRDIGRRLFISERTSETHVSHILRKLDLPSRSAIAAWITRQDQ